MAGFTDTLRGDGLVRAQRALAGLQGDPLRLDRARQRFSHSPPPYTSNPSGTTTRSASPIPPSEERRQERRFQLGQERMASEPYHQFEHQISDEKKRIMEADLNGTHRIPVGSDAYTIACETVKKRWVEQGIWNSKWNQFASGRWKHEEPLEIESEPETDSEAEPSPPLFSFVSKPQPKPRRPKSDDEKRQIAERRVVREPPAIRIFGSPSPVQSNHRQVSGALNSSQQGPPADIASAGSENGDAEHPPSAPNSPRPRTGKRVLRPTTGQVLGPSRRKQSQKDGQPQSVASASLGPVHPSKVSKAAGKTKPGRQRPLNISQEVSSGGLPLSSGVDAAEPQPSPPPDRVTPRRSKRIQPPVSKDPAKTASTDPSKGAVRSKPERKVASNPTTRSSAKPQGVLKRQLAKTTRGKAREK
ncbi:hypothetical protein BGZ57DRAFT_759154 [Hyaloscypha finlandica]|nr:hypothetical protein BGZ57DRAFT_759154 [Hyaloscypha finlandica]